MKDPWSFDAPKKKTNLAKLNQAAQSTIAKNLVTIDKIREENHIQDIKYEEELKASVKEVGWVPEMTYLEVQAAAQFEAGAKIEDVRRLLAEAVAWGKAQEWYEETLEGFARIRKMSIEAIRKTDGFFLPPYDIFVNDLPKELQDPIYGMTSIRKGERVLTYRGRFILPVKDVYGNVMGFCGYDKESVNKYRDSKNFGYKAKLSTIYGMEMLPQYYKDGYCVFAEGPMCTVRARECGLNCCSLFGSYINPYAACIINRFGENAIILHDDDEAGFKFRKQAKKLCPKAVILCSRVAKDLDDSVLAVGMPFCEELINILNDRSYARQYTNY